MKRVSYLENRNLKKKTFLRSVFFVLRTSVNGRYGEQLESFKQ